MFKNFLVALIVLFIASYAFDQSITGFVLDEDNNPLPFTKVYLKNFSTTGAISDIEGKYFFGCDMGTYEVIYKCVGFDDKAVKVRKSAMQMVKNAMG